MTTFGVTTYAILCMSSVIMILPPWACGDVALLAILA
jgi:hypothetical protein